jgi:hypothetical protein
MSHSVTTSPAEAVSRTLSWLLVARKKKKTYHQKWFETRDWAEDRITAWKYKSPGKQRRSGTVAWSDQMQAARFYQLKMGHCFAGQ